MICEICGQELQPIDTRYIPATDRPDLELKSEPMIENKYVCICKKIIFIWTKMENNIIY